MARWHLLHDRHPRSAAENMAIDEYLFNICHRERRGFLRLYRWLRPTFSFGFSQKAEKAIDREFITAQGCDYVRRITGGKTVLHDNEITYALVSSEETFYRDHDLFQSYTLIARVLVEALRRLGVDAALSRGSSGELSRSHNPCFSFPTPSEIEVGGRKIIGSAQKRDKQALLQHGSIPLTMDYELYARGTRSRSEAIAAAMTTLKDAAGGAGETGDELCAALIGAFGDFVKSDLSAFDLGAEAGADLEPLYRKYASAEWNLAV